MNRLNLWTFLICIILTFPSSVTGEGTLVDCDIQTGPCTKSLPGCQVTLDILPKPVKAMRDLTFVLCLAGKKPDAEPYIDLDMPAMHMGRNRVRLEPAGKDEYRGKGVIVRCASGKRTWKATVTVPGSGVVEFIFDVVY